MLKKVISILLLIVVVLSNVAFSASATETQNKASYDFEVVKGVVENNRTVYYDEDGNEDDISAYNRNISMFSDEEEQREAASLFHTSLPKLDTKQEQEKAFRDIVLAVKRSSFEYYTSKLGTDVNALKQVIEGKKALEELAKTHISLD